MAQVDQPDLDLGITTIGRGEDVDGIDEPTLPHEVVRHGEPVLESHRRCVVRHAIDPDGAVSRSAEHLL